MSMFREAPTESCPKGQLSFRRVSGFFFGGVIGSVSGMTAIILRAEWLVVAVAIGIPYATLIVLAICTTVSDIKSIVAIAKEIKEGQ